MGNIFSDEPDYSNPEVLGGEFPLFEERLDDSIQINIEKLEKQRKNFSTSNEDWDYRIGNWIDDIPYLWKCKDESDWRTCTRTYLFADGPEGYKSLTGRTKNPYVENLFLAGSFPISVRQAKNLRRNGRPIYSSVDLKRDPEYKFTPNFGEGYDPGQIIGRVSDLIFNYPENIVVRDIADRETYYNKPIPEKERFVVALYMRYLQKKYPNVCFPLFMSKESEEIVTKTPSQIALGEPGGDRTNFVGGVNMDISYVRIFSNDAFTQISVKNAKEVVRSLVNCFKKDRRFICLLIALVIGDNFSHANLMVIDRQSGKIYIVDPWGEQTMIPWKDGLEIPYKMFINRIIVPISKSKFWLIQNSGYICPYNSFQNLEDFGDMTWDDPGGFCYLWSLYIADLLMSNPDEEFSEVIRKAIAHIKSHHKSFTNFIRAFAVYIHENFDEGEFTDAGPRVKYDYLRRIAVDYERYLNEVGV